MRDDSDYSEVPRPCRSYCRSQPARERSQRSDGGGSAPAAAAGGTEPRLWSKNRVACASNIAPGLFKRDSEDRRNSGSPRLGAFAAGRVPARLLHGWFSPERAWCRNLYRPDFAAVPDDAGVTGERCCTISYSERSGASIVSCGFQCQSGRNIEDIDRMCGIAGVVSADRTERIEEALVRQMCDAIVHRGPDDEGLLTQRNVGLGMRRLSIIDLAGGHQPIFNEDRSAWIVFNGEIYNFPELRPELEARGHRFTTHTDTETIVHLYEDMGADCVQKLRGMFAFALWDDRRQSLLIARDRLGKKPLHYALHNGKIYFASEIKAILTVAPELAEVNRAALMQYMYLGYVPDPATAFRNIHKLPPGHLLEFQRGEIRVRKYWDLPQYSTYQPRSEEELLEELEARLAEATRIRLISDVPLGAMLSGGTDSSTVVALMARASSKPVKTFAIGFRQADFDESQYARLVAQKFATEHHELVLEPDVVASLEKLTSSLEEPFSDPSILPTYFVSCLARQHVTVALSGDGGDELFAGYTRYGIQQRRQVSALLPQRLWRLYRERLFPFLPKGMRGRQLSYNLSLPWRERYADEVCLIPVFERDMPLLSPEFRATIAESGDPQEILLKLFDAAPASDPISQMLYVDTKTYLVEDILTKVDRM